MTALYIPEFIFIAQFHENFLYLGMLEVALEKSNIRFTLLDKFGLSHYGLEHKI